MVARRASSPEPLSARQILIRRIVFAHGGGASGRAQAQFQSAWAFEALGPRTRVTIDMVFATAAERDLIARDYGAIEGGHQTLQRLAEQLEIDRSSGPA